MKYICFRFEAEGKAGESGRIIHLKTKDMEVIDHAGRLYRGRMGNLIYYTVNGRTYVRRASKRPGAPAKPRTEKQKGMARRFAMVQKVYTFYKEKVSAEVWEVAAQATGQRGRNLFCSANSGCYDGTGQMVSPETFQFSAGELLLPRGLQVEALGGGRFRATWTEERDLVTAAPGDRLQAGVLYETALAGPYPAVSVSGTRADGCGEFALETGQDDWAYVYLYFAREDGTAYSPSMHFRVTIKDER